MCRKKKKSHLRGARRKKMSLELKPMSSFHTALDGIQGPPGQVQSPVLHIFKCHPPALETLEVAKHKIGGRRSSLCLSFIYQQQGPRNGDTHHPLTYSILTFNPHQPCEVGIIFPTLQIGKQSQRD